MQTRRPINWPSTFDDLALISTFLYSIMFDERTNALREPISICIRVFGTERMIQSSFWLKDFFTLSLGVVFFFRSEIAKSQGKIISYSFISVKQARFSFYSSVFLYFSSSPVKIKVSQGRLFLFFIRQESRRRRRKRRVLLARHSLSLSLSPSYSLYIVTSFLRRVDFTFAKEKPEEKRKQKKIVRNGNHKTNCIIIFPPKIRNL